MINIYLGGSKFIDRFCKMEAKTREEFLFMAQVFQQAERFDEMVNAMNNAIALDARLNQIERNLLVVAYKNSIGPLRAARRTLEEVEKKEQIKENNQLRLVKAYRATIEEEICKYCREIIDFIDIKLLQGSNDNAETQIFYYKTKGDFLRYMSECTEKMHEDAGKNAEASYKMATLKMNQSYENHHVLRLSLALNQAVHEYDFNKNTAKACQIARDAFQPFHDFDTTSEEQYRQMTNLYQLLRDNLATWTAQLQEDEGH